MSHNQSYGTFILLCCLMYPVECEDDQCRQLDFRAALAFRGHRLLNHAIGVSEVIAEDFCGALCFMEPNCVSYNILESSDSPPITKCELNDVTYFEHPGDLVPFPNSTYHGSKNACIKKPCLINNTCQAGFTSQGYRCMCEPGYTGVNCADDVNECDLGGHDCDSNADCVNAPGSYDCKCKEGFSGDGRTCAADGCHNYSTLSDANRKSSYVTPNHPILCEDQLPEVWHRFVGAAGTKMPTTRVPTYRCGTRYSGWLDGAHPSVEDGEVVRNVCFSKHPTGCTYSNVISVKNCGSYFIYKLPKPPKCGLRYCGTD